MVPKGRQAQLHGKQHVAGAGELSGCARAQARNQHAQHLLVPGLGKTPAGAVVGDLELAQAVGVQQRDLVVEPLAAFDEIRHRRRVAEIHLVDDGQHRDLEQDGVQPGPVDRDVDLAGGQRGDGDVFLVEPEQAEEIDEIALDETQRAQVGQLRVLEVQAAQRADLVADLADVRAQVDARVAAA
jgi:hypothetical protein